jgi:hypothetical protein
MKIKAVEPYEEVECKICGEFGTLKKNIGNYCYDCLKRYKIEYPEYIDPEQYYMFMKIELEKTFDTPEEI